MCVFYATSKTEEAPQVITAKPKATRPPQVTWHRPFSQPRAPQEAKQDIETDIEYYEWCQDTWTDIEAAIDSPGFFGVSINHPERVGPGT